MARANERDLSRLLLTATTKYDPRKILRFGFFDYLYPFRFEARLSREGRLSRYDAKDIAAYMSAGFNLLPPPQQNFFLQRLQREFPEVPWHEAFVGTGVSSEAGSAGSYFAESDGPDLLPRVSIDEFRDVLFKIDEEFARDDQSHIAERVLEEVAEDDDKRRTMYWSIRLFLKLRERAADIAHRVAGFWQFAVGFLDPVAEGNAFGVIALAQGDVTESTEAFTPIEIDKTLFQVVVRPITIAEHALPAMHPSNGTVACWAKSRANTKNSKLGVLTAKHVAGTRIGSRLKFNGAIGKVVDVAPDGIDAALVDPPDTFDKASKRLKAAVAVAPWIDVEFIGTASGAHTTKVLSTTDQLGILNSPLFPVRILLADHGESGDSGALITETFGGSQQRAIGLYMGQFTDQAARIGGLAQHMEQVVQIMDMELYQ
jgi:hypothetical protein